MTAAFVRPATVDHLVVRSAAMGRDIAVAFLGGGLHAMHLLDAFEGGDAVSASNTRWTRLQEKAFRRWPRAAAASSLDCRPILPLESSRSNEKLYTRGEMV